MPKELIISSTSLESRLAILEDDQVTEIFIERAKNKGILGNVYKGKVMKVLPGMQAAFVDIGLERNAFLYVSDLVESDAFEIFDETSRDESAPERKKQTRRSTRRGRRETPPQEPLPEVVPQVLNHLGPARDRPLQIGVVIPEELPPLTPEHAKLSAKLKKKKAPEEERILPERLEALVPYRKPLWSAPASDEPAPKSAPKPKASAEATSPVGGSSTDTLGEGRAEFRMESGPKVRPMLTSKREPRSQKRRSSAPRGNVRSLIADLLTEGQEVLVQISKEPIGKKGARITSHVALPGRYMVYMPTVDHIGVSRRIASDRERQRLRRIVSENRGPTGRGFIVRTAGEKHKEADLIRDIQYLTRLWDDVLSSSEKGKAPRLIHAELSLIERVIRDHLTGDFRAIRVDDEDTYERIVELIDRFNPQLVNRVLLYTKPTPIFEEFGISVEMEKALKEKVWLKNGGYIVINHTEALVAIDVNTGKFVGSTDSLEDTITRTNLNAVKETVRQIRLRDLGGIIIIDFIDMDERRNRQKVMEMLQIELRKDKSPSKILQFNEFGLVAITRKRVKQSLEKTLCQPCVYCEGTGMTKSVRTICYTIHEEVRKMLPDFGESQELIIRCHPDVGRALRNGESQVIREIKDMTGRFVTVKTEPMMHIEKFDLVEV